MRISLRCTLIDCRRTEGCGYNSNVNVTPIFQLEVFLSLSFIYSLVDSNVTCGSNNKTAGSIQNEKRVERNQLQLSCSVTYSGNFPLQMQWIKVGSELQTNETNCGDVGNRVVCNVTMEVNNDMDGSVYICRIITAEQYNCSFEDNKTVCKFNIRANFSFMKSGSTL